ncbi:MAG: decaprenyl-phosphate phosphoribosyltransferase [Pseudomonadota bacterium]
MTEPSPALRQDTRSHAAPYYLLLSMRPGQWVKNFFVLTPLLFSGHLFQTTAAARALGAFLLFCLASGMVYLLNDLVDLERDRKHPLKMSRPLASGALSPRLAVLFSLAMLPPVVAGSWWLSRALLMIISLYAVNNILYSFFLKHLVIVDVMSISLGFILRVMAGSEVIGVPHSSWLLLCTGLLALFLGFGKRRHELVLLEGDAGSHRQVLDHYGTRFLDQMIAVVAASTVISYALYTMSAQTLSKFGTDKLVYTTPFVLYGIFRYLYLIHQRNQGGSPTEVVLRDRAIILNVLLWGLSSGLIIYWRP